MSSKNNFYCKSSKYWHSKQCTLVHYFVKNEKSSTLSPFYWNIGPHILTKLSDCVSVGISCYKMGDLDIGYKNQSQLVP